MSIRNDVVNLLGEYINGIRKAQNTIEGYRSSMKAGEMSPQAIKEAENVIAAQQRYIDGAPYNAAQDVEKLLSAYQASERAKDALNPADITEDAKLFSAGVSLTERDIQDILARNADNRTMAILTLRYAEEHKIILPGAYQYNTAESRAKKAADTLRTSTHYYTEHWLKSDKADEMLNKLFDYDVQGGQIVNGAPEAE